MSAKKKEFEELFNKIFGVSVKWSRLSLEELTQIATVLANSDSLCKKICKECVGGETKYITLLKSLKDMLKDVPFEGPIVKVLRKMFGIEESEDGKEAEKQD
uniref:Uncharacterized protein n=1 Tax=Ignisphaera aggregans TaxID=334771 RepID=A0A7J2TCK7_9CREN